MLGAVRHLPSLHSPAHGRYYWPWVIGWYIADDQLMLVKRMNKNGETGPETGHDLCSLWHLYATDFAQAHARPP